MSETDKPTLAELLAGETLGNLTEAERAELDQLKNASPQEAADLSREFETAASAIQSIGATDVDPLPAQLANSIRESGYQAIACNHALEDESRKVRLSRDQGIGRRELIAWAVMATAILACFGLWVSQDDNATTVAAVPTSELREELIQLPSVTKVAWANGTSPFDKPVTGEVVWDTDRQQGVMRFVGMPVNNPTVEQYQLWIVDPERDDEPIDGGVFDITSNGEVLVSIDAKLKVINPAAFAITIEKPGGVVVSTQQRLPLLAAVAKR